MYAKLLYGHASVQNVESKGQQKVCATQLWIWRQGTMSIAVSKALKQSLCFLHTRQAEPGQIRLCRRIGGNSNWKNRRTYRIVIVKICCFQNHFDLWKFKLVPGRSFSSLAHFKDFPSSEGTAAFGLLSGEISRELLLVAREPRHLALFPHLWTVWTFKDGLRSAATALFIVQMIGQRWQIPCE